MLTHIAQATLALLLIGGAAVSWWNHGKPIAGRSNCTPVIVAAVIEGVLIYVACGYMS